MLRLHGTGPSRAGVDVMQEVLAVRHVGFEHLGTLAPLLSGRGFRIRYLDAGVGDLTTVDPEAPALLAILGGPIGAYEEDQYPFLLDELRLIERRLAAQRPLIGICLGAQLMARALGSRVFPGRAKEVGWAPLTLTPEGRGSCLADLEGCGHQVLHWHGDTFDLPEGTRRLASTPIAENQAFALGDKALGLQFHLEVDPSEVERWLIGHALEIALTEGVSPTSIRADTARHGPALAAAATGCMTRWLQQANLLPPAEPVEG
jgi:GMP synthase (glutamine-hydrolysing)